MFSKFSVLLSKFLSAFLILAEKGSGTGFLGSHFFFQLDISVWQCVTDMIFVISSTSSASVKIFGSEGTLNVEVLQMIL